MKKLLLLASWVVTSAFAQNQEGVVSYDQTIKLQFRIEGMSEAEMERLPKTRTNKMQLAFTPAECLYKAVDTPDETQNNGEGMQMVIRRPMNEIYTNFTQNKKVSLQDFAGKKFLIEDDLKLVAWKLSDETKQIKGYTCQKATYTRIEGERKTNIVAWFTMDIPISAGPDGLGGLPGLILETNLDDGRNITTATNISFKKPTSDELRVPSGGKKVSQAEFQKIRDDYMKEMGAQPGSNNVIRIIRN